MWVIETYRESGEYHQVLDERFPKYETLEEAISDDLETALGVFAERYPYGDYTINMVWYGGVKSFYAEEIQCRYINTAAVLCKK